MRRSSKCGKRRILDSPNSICIVIFEVVYNWSLGSWVYKFVPISQYEVERRTDLLVAFDHVYSFDWSGNPVHVLLHTSESLRPINPFDDTPMPCPSHIFSNMVRVLPVFHRQSQIPLLPLEVMYSIVKFALGGKNTGWRRRLLVYGLVCKSWARALDLALGGFEDAVEYDYPGVISVARAVEARPERAAAIKTFDPSLFEFNIQPSGPSATEKWEAILTILSHAKSAQVVRLTYINPVYRERFLQLLQSLREVRKCIMEFPKSTNKFFRGSSFDLKDVLTGISEWEHLEILELSNFKIHHDLSSPQLKFNLKRLKFQSGTLDVTHLMLFAVTPRLRLEELHLKDVKELPNRDFFAFLAAVAPTLSHLIVLGCIFSRESGEEHAIDAAIPILVVLKTLSTDGYCATELALTRKTKKPSICDVDYRIFLGPASPGVTFAGAAQAMDVTAWSSVSLLWPDKTGWQQTLVDQARRRAEARQIKFDCRVARNVAL
ncbi:hypothetical protein H0H92_000954 [Tricholoma furcatifolium]|nr:hypothetical protein H0H92_000954 [Tricholoma furcatifolium]